ncbi:BTB/POZ domain-containing protein At5g03250-like [Rhodamnia argentea]|uniref:BTB/POZ domain-containing protein At5g03250-like n=1 Tax=Rhodamnia argentea TaxID=178133 RepID=A0A8B8QSU9_9MYRT|nr:BTB/POZ domain-containing protein At5g03250-like [Rhodamnia argentea]
MACMKLGSKPEAFRLDGNSWICLTGLPSDVVIEVGDTSFHLHKFPLLSRSGLLESRIGECSRDDEQKCTVRLDEIPGGAKTFLLVAKFCYGVKLELTATNVVSIRCAAEYLRMNEDYGDANLIVQTENFMNEIFGSWSDSIKVLETCEEVLTQAEELHVVSRCITSLAMKACADLSLFTWPVSSHGGSESPADSAYWNGICAAGKADSISEDWWYEDASILKLSFYRRLILAISNRGMKPERVAGSVMHYAVRHLPLMHRQSSLQNRKLAATCSTISASPEVDQKNLLEQIVELLPYQKAVFPTNFLLRLLRTSMILHAGSLCRENLERRIGAQLEQALLKDLLIPNMGCSAETLYDIDCVQRILDHFIEEECDAYDLNTNCLEGQPRGGSHASTPMTMVANLVDSYLSEVAPDVNLKLPKFQSLAAAIPEYARPLDDGIYRATDIYLKAHPWLTDSEREQLCRLMNCQKLSLEASTHAAQNERLPLRVIVQVLFFEQLRLRTSVAGWFFVSDNLDASQNPSSDLVLARTEAPDPGATTQQFTMAAGDMRERVCELEKECLSMRQDLEKLVKTRGSWNILFRRLAFRLKSKSPKLPKPFDDAKDSEISTATLVDGKESHRNTEKEEPSKI